MKTRSGLVTRDQFREGVFARDKHKCVFCGSPAQDAHHILERRLFPDGGYYLDNGASVCGEHHIACERTDISVEEVRTAAGITRVVVPPHFDPALSYTKWGDIVLPNGARLKGELFESARKTISAHLDRYTGVAMHAIIKYPRTAHLVGSKLQGDDTSDGQIPVHMLTDGELIWEEKVDGGNCGVSFNDDADMILQSRGHALMGGPREGQFDLFKSWARSHEGSFFDILSNRYIMYGEWCYAKHTVFYDRLPHYFLEFDIFDKETGLFLGTDERHKMLAGSPVVSVPVVHRGHLKATKEVRALIKPSLYKSETWRDSLAKAAEKAGVDPEQALRETNDSDLAEGLYLKQEANGQVIGRYKFVRPDFLQAILDSGSHWIERTVIPNQLAEGVEIFR